MNLGNFSLWQWILGVATTAPSAIQDIKEKRIRILPCLVGIILGIVFNLIGEKGIAAVFGGLVPGAFLLLCSAVSREAVGCGDGVILMAIGSIIGGVYGAMALMDALIVSGLVSLVLLTVKKAGRSTTIPFVPFLFAGFVITGIWK